MSDLECVHGLRREFCVICTPSNASRARLVIVSDGYLDGIMAVSVARPCEWDETVREVDASILDAYEEAWAAVWAAGKAVQSAWGAALEIPNPIYVKPEDDHD